MPVDARRTGDYAAGVNDALNLRLPVGGLLLLLRGPAVGV